MRTWNARSPAEVRDRQSGIGGYDPHQGYRVDVEALGHHLRPDQDVFGPGDEALQQRGVLVCRSCGVAVPAQDTGPGKPSVDLFHHGLGAGSERDQRARPADRAVGPIAGLQVAVVAYEPDASVLFPGNGVGREGGRATPALQ